jgi:hypothetical protein
MICTSHIVTFSSYSSLIVVGCKYTWHRTRFRGIFARRPARCDAFIDQPPTTATLDCTELTNGDRDDNDHDNDEESLKTTKKGGMKKRGRRGDGGGDGN